MVSLALPGVKLKFLARLVDREWRHFPLADRLMICVPAGEPTDRLGCVDLCAPLWPDGRLQSIALGKEKLFYMQASSKPPK